MTRYRYDGQHPEADGETIVSPGEVREFSKAPDWGLWTELPADGAEPPAAAAPASPAPPAPPAPPRASTPPAAAKED
jgi:hypothetical protein